MCERDSVIKAKTWVVKVGTQVCLNEHGSVNSRLLLDLAQQIETLRRQGRQVILVSSGAVGLGRELLKIDGLGDNLPIKQALAAIGQVEIMNAYKHIFSLLGIHVAQVLLTRDDVSARERYLNARHTLQQLAQYGVLPIINENDSVATGEIRFGDNDNLAAMVGSIINADIVVNLTSAPGILCDDPNNPGHDWVLPLVREITPEIEALDRGTKTSGGTGGLASKLQAAKSVLHYGGSMVIASARAQQVLPRLAAGESLGTLFSGSDNHLNSRQRWLSLAAFPEGSLVVDGGAAQALRQGSCSLLPVGITKVEGFFPAGSLVTVKTTDGEEVGRGLSNYGSEELSRIMGRSTASIAELLGHCAYEEAVLCDNFVLSD